MRYQKEIEAIFKISEEFGSKVLTKYVLGAGYVERVGRRDLASLSQKLADISALYKHNSKIVRFHEELQKRDNYLRANFSDFSAPEKTLWANVQKAVQHELEDSSQILESETRIFHSLRMDVESILTNSGHCDLADLYPYIEKDSQDQILILKVILDMMYPNGRENHIVVGSSHDTAKTQNPTNESTNMSLDSDVIETEAPKNDMVTVDLNTQDTQLNPNPNPIPKSDSSKMILEVQDTKQNYKTKALKMSKGSMTQMSLIKRREKCSKVRKIQTPRMYKKKLKSQLEMRAQWSLNSKHKNNTRLHNKTFNTKFMVLRGIMKSVKGAFQNTFPFQDRLLLRRPRVKIK